MERKESIALRLNESENDPLRGRLLVRIWIFPMTEKVQDSHQFILLLLLHIFLILLYLNMKAPDKLQEIHLSKLLLLPNLHQKALETQSTSTSTRPTLTYSMPTFTNSLFTALNKLSFLHKKIMRMNKSCFCVTLLLQSNWGFTARVIIQNTYSEHFK